LISPESAPDEKLRLAREIEGALFSAESPCASAIAPAFSIYAFELTLISPPFAEPRAFATTELPGSITMNWNCWFRRRKPDQHLDERF
jgi:hypothetical protein